MPITSRPDLLPFGGLVTIGCPYHGVVEWDVANDTGVLDLPNATTLDYPMPSTGKTILVEHPAAAALQRSAEDAAADSEAGREWRTYALLSGSSRQLCGQSIGSGNYWLYCDAEAAWLIEVVFSQPTSTSQKLEAYLRKVIGRFPGPSVDLSMSSRLLASIEFTPVYYGGTPQTVTAAGLERRVFATYSKTGAIAVFNVGALGPVGLPWDDTVCVFTDYFNEQWGIHNSIKLDISGTGSLIPGSVGAGITAAFTMLADATDMQTDSGGSTEWACEGTFCEGSFVTYSDFWMEYEFYWVVTPAGALVVHRRRIEGSTTYTYAGLDCDACTYSSVSASSTYLKTLSFAGVTVETDNSDVFMTWVQDDLLCVRQPSGVEGTLITSTGVSKYVTWTDDPPFYMNTTWNQATGDIEFRETKEICYV